MHLVSLGYTVNAGTVERRVEQNARVAEARRILQRVALLPHSRDDRIHFVATSVIPS